MSPCSRGITGKWWAIELHFQLRSRKKNTRFTLSLCPLPFAADNEGYRCSNNSQPVNGISRHARGFTCRFGKQHENLTPNWYSMWKILFSQDQMRCHKHTSREKELASLPIFKFLTMKLIWVRWPVESKNRSSWHYISLSCSVLLTCEYSVRET